MVDLEQTARKAFKQSQDDDKRNYSRGWGSPATKEQLELFERAYSDRLWERKVISVSRPHKKYVTLHLDDGSSYGFGG